MNIIVAVDQNWGIGKDNDLLFKISEDLKNFRKTTSGKVVVMGRKTLESLPNGKPLPKRVNIVLTTKGTPENVVVVRNFAELATEIDKYEDEIFIIGGERIYTDLLPYVEKCYITHIAAKKAADKFFPNLSKMKNWRIVSESEEMKENDLSFRYLVWENDNPMKL